MSRSVQAFNAVERRIDRGITSERRKEAARLRQEKAALNVNASLGALSPTEAPEAALEHGKAFFRRYAELTDAPRAASALGDLCGELCGEIEGPKAAALRAAKRLLPDRDSAE